MGKLSGGSFAQIGDALYATEFPTFIQTGNLFTPSQCYLAVQRGPTDEGPFDTLHESGLLTPSQDPSTPPDPAEIDAYEDEEALFLEILDPWWSAITAFEWAATPTDDPPVTWTPVTCPLSQHIITLDPTENDQPFYLWHRLKLPGCDLWSDLGSTIVGGA